MIDHDRFKKQVQDAAAPLFRHLGYHKTTMTDIARAVGKGKSSLYYYYRSKEEVFKAVVLREAMGFRSVIIQAISQPDDPMEKLKRYVLTRMQTLHQFHNFYTAMTDEQLATMPFVKKLHNAYASEEIRLFRSVLDEGVRKNYFNINDIWLAALAIVMAMKGIEERLFVIQDTHEFERRLDDVINIIFYGVVSR